MLKNVDDPSRYESVENILRDSIMVDSLDFEQLKNWNGSAPLVSDLDLSAYPTTGELFSLNDTSFFSPPVKSVSSRKILAFYVYIHKYRIKKKHTKKLKAKAFLYDPKRRIIFAESSYEAIINSFPYSLTHN